MTPDKQAQAGVHAPGGRELADLIETRLLGVAPDEQDLDLEDDDWRMILAALRTPPPAQGQVEAATNAEAVAWRCFHCGETFTDEVAARLHFGRDERSEAACLIKAGAEMSLLKALRDAEYQADDAIQRMHDESTDAAKAHHQQRCRHTQSLIAAEELGYERGLADGRNLASPPATPPQVSEAQVEAVAKAIYAPSAAEAESSVRWEHVTGQVQAVYRNMARAAIAALSPQTSAVADERVEAIRQEIINSPETADFMAGVPLEAAHQRERWGAEHDAGKSPFDWFWLIGYLAQKAADAQSRGDTDKALHHTISTGAALANWHAAISGKSTSMRPGIEPPAALTTGAPNPGGAS
jgi:hypothetical protein